MKHWLAVVALVCFGSPALAAQDPVCDKGWKVEQRVVHTTQDVELLGVNNSSGTFQSARRGVWVFNLDSTAANAVWISSFQVTATVAGVIDTQKKVPIWGGQTRDSWMFFPFAQNLRLYASKALGTGSKVAVATCE